MSNEKLQDTTNQPRLQKKSEFEIFREICRITTDTRAERLVKHFELDPSEVDREDWPHEDPLLGYCHENALFLARRLSQAGYEPHIIWGAMKEGNFDPPETVKEAEEQMCVHFWVEVQPNGADPIIADLAQEGKGWPLISRSLPDNYIRLPKGRIKFDPEAIEITTNSLRNYEGYEYILENGYI